MAFWGMLYTDAAGFVSQSPEQLMKKIGAGVVMCMAFGLTVSEAKTEIMGLRTKRMLESTATFRVEAAGQVYNQTNEFVYLAGDVNHIEVNRRIRNAWYCFRKYSTRAQNKDAKGRGTQNNALRLRHVEPARVPLRHAAPSLSQLSDLLHRLAKAQSRRSPDFLSEQAYEDGK